MFTLIIEDKNGAIVDEYSFEDGEFIVGRSQQADIVLPADNVSRRHARLFTVDGRCYIEDLKAANGVWLNGKRVHNVVELPRSAQVRIGDFFLHIEGAAYARPLGSATYARLVPMPGSIGELTELTQPTILIGRGKDCAVVLSDVSVSRIHAKITQENSGRVLVEDLRSSNGTYVNDRRIDHQDLQHGDRIRFGTVAFSFQVEGMPEVEAVEPAPAYVPARQHEGNRNYDRQSASRQQQQNVYASQYNAYAPVDHGQAPADGGYAPPQRSMLPQVAALAVILVAVVGLIILVAFFYDRWVKPNLVATVPAVVAPVPAAAAAKPPSAEAVGTATAEVQLDDLIARGKDALVRRQWDEADVLFKRARKLDPIDARPTEAVNMISMEKKASSHFATAEKAFENKDYDTAIQRHRMIPQNSVYRADANMALDSIAGLLELEGDNHCAKKDFVACQDRYSLALKTGFAAPTVEQKLLKIPRKGKAE